MNCLITGISGYIGSHLALRLIDQGHQVTGLIHQSLPTIVNDDVSYIYGDITQFSQIKDCARNMDFVFHCAGLVNDYASNQHLFDVHVNGTKNLVNSCKRHQCKRFVFLSHIPYECSKKTYPYPESKAQAESFLIDEYKNKGFPMVIIRPGNVYGPNAPTWVLRPVKALKEKRIALIDGGNGIFHHTYIVNLIDALISCLDSEGINGEIFDITDGDSSITWKRYFNDLAEIIGTDQITRNLSYPVAKIIGHFMLLGDRLFGIPPLVTPYAVEIFSNTTKLSIDKARHKLGYEPTIDYDQGMKKIKQWIIDQGIDSILSTRA